MESNSIYLINYKKFNNHRKEQPKKKIVSKNVFITAFV